MRILIFSTWTFILGSPLCDNDGMCLCQFFLENNLNGTSVVQMKYGRLCKRLQPHGDIERFTKKKMLMNAILGQFEIIW